MDKPSLEDILKGGWNRGDVGRDRYYEVKVTQVDAKGENREVLIDMKKVGVVGGALLSDDHDVKGFFIGQATASELLTALGQLEELKAEMISKLMSNKMQMKADGKDDVQGGFIDDKG